MDLMLETLERFDFLGIATLLLLLNTLTYLGCLRLD
jgi:hypothetical protein